MRARQRAVGAIGAGLVLAAASLVWRLGPRLDLPLQWLAIVLLLPGVAFAVMSAIGGQRSGRVLESSSLDAVIGVGLAIGVVSFTISLFLVLVPPTDISWVGFVAIVLTVCALAAWNHRSDSFVPFVAVLVALGVVLILVMSTMDGRGDSLDVMMFQVEGSEAMISGENPYGIRFINPYSPEDSPTFYDPSLTRNGMLLFGFPYPPTSLALVLPFEAAFDDFRLAQALAYLVTAVAIVGILPTSAGRRIAVAFLLVSPLLYVVGFGWTEPLVMVSAAGVVLAATRGSPAAPFLVGVTVSLKQYAALLLPASLLLVERPWTVSKVWSAMWPPLAVVFVTMIPFVLWGPSDFFQSVVAVQFVQPFRPDSLAFPALMTDVIGTPPAVAVTVAQGLAVVGAIVVCLRRCPIGAHGFALGSAVIMLALFTFSKQAFPNYYSLAIGLLFVGAAAALRHSANDDATVRAQESKESFTS